MTRGVLVMAYGTPASIDDVAAYYTDIRGGRPPTEELLEELTQRYRAIGGHSPLLEITRAQAGGIQERVDDITCYVGQKHAAPFIPDALRQIAADGIDDVVGLVLAPHYSSMSVGDYERRAREAASEQGWNGRFRMIESWHLEPAFVALLAERVKDALGQLSDSARADAVVIFTAHSLPTSILEKGDPYPDQLQQTADKVASQAGLERWQIGWQSAGRTTVPWIGPDLLEIMVDLAAKNVPGVVVCPCGFVADHLEVLYDVDIEARALAFDLEIELARTASPNDDPAFLDMLAGVVSRAFG
ncbi:MAG: protoporphyrin/coproporphyrin ferrochelatase [Actinomycetota bacterium]|jgi:ferrochelatase|nr:protoporphyrin/coproporphyrin ferrochelatase [Actinomycetota bacterium]